MLNVGFIEEQHRPKDIRDIGKCLNHLHRHQGEADMFGGLLWICLSISKYYIIDYVPDDTDEPKRMEDIRWRIAVPDSIDSDSGIYFLRTNVDSLDERTTWDYYNLTREIECTNRQLKTDLSLRPIHHQSDGSSDAHLFFGLLSYWIVNTIKMRKRFTSN